MKRNFFGSIRKFSHRTLQCVIKSNIDWIRQIRLGSWISRGLSIGLAAFPPTVGRVVSRWLRRRRTRCNSRTSRGRECIGASPIFISNRRFRVVRLDGAPHGRIERQCGHGGLLGRGAHRFIAHSAVTRDGGGLSSRIEGLHRLNPPKADDHPLCEHLTRDVALSRAEHDRRHETPLVYSRALLMHWLAGEAVSIGRDGSIAG
jgi:hypothetical protein